MENKKITNLEELINQTKQNLKDTGYSSTSLCVHGKIWRELSEYLSSKGIASYAPVNGLDYLHYKINYPEVLERTLTHDERDFIEPSVSLTNIRKTAQSLQPFHAGVSYGTAKQKACGKSLKFSARKT